MSSASSEAGEDSAGQLHSTTVSVLCIGMIFCHICLGTGLFSYLVPDWSLFESLWFSVVTTTTVGYGDYVPNQNDTAKMFGAVYIWVSLLLLSFCVGLIACAKMEKAEGSDEETHVQILPNVGSLALILLIGTLLFPFVDETGKWDFVDGFYYSTVSLSTVGYGALIPEGTVAKSIAMVYIFIGTVVTGTLVSGIVDTFIDNKKKKERERFFTQKLDMRKLEAMNDDGVGGVNEVEFLQFMLSETGLVDEGEIKYIRKTFAKMDVDNSGELSIEDLLQSELMTKAAAAHGSSRPPSLRPSPPPSRAGD